MKYKIKIDNNPLPFELGDSELADSLVVGGTTFEVAIFEHPDGPFSTGKDVIYKFEVAGVTAHFKGSNERGLEVTGQNTLHLNYKAKEK